MTIRWCAIAVLGGVSVANAAPDPWAADAPAPAPRELKGPAAEIGTDLGSPLPAVPAFEIAVPAGGAHGARELAVQGKALLGTEIRASGYVLWIYDCATALRKPGESAAKVQKRIDEDPTLCQRKSLFLGDAKDTPTERGLWVVDVPRPPNKLEKERLPKEDLAAWPKVPAIAAGDYVTITGTFALTSPHSERASDGLLVWKDFAPATPGAMTTKQVPSAPSKVAPLVVKAVVRPPKDLAARNASVKASNEGTRAYAQKQPDTALDRYRAAVAAWDGNHLAWYGMAGALIGKGDWRAATDAMKHAFELAPDQPMYATIYGYTLYNQIIDDAKGADLSTLDFSRPSALLQRAIQLNDKMWRAHYYLGRIERDAGRPKAAAEEFTKAVARTPRDSAPWVALAELYRKWQRPDLAEQVATQGTLNVPGDEAQHVWFALGMSLDDQRANAKAIEAFTHALDVNPDHEKALFQRGQTYFRTRDFAKAKADLERYVKAAPADQAFAKEQATKMLMDIAAKRR